MQGSRRAFRCEAGIFYGDSHGDSQSQMLKEVLSKHLDYSIAIVFYDINLYYITVYYVILW